MIVMCSVRIRVGFEKPETAASAEGAGRRNPAAFAGAVRPSQAEDESKVDEITGTACAAGLKSTATCFPRRS